MSAAAQGDLPQRRRRTGVIALAVPNLEEPYFAELTALLCRRANDRGLAILIQQTEGDHEREVDIANGVGLPETDGLIHIPRALTVADLTRRTSPGPLVLLGEHIQISPFTHITIDNRRAAADATAHLADVGRRRVAFVGPRDSRPSDAADQRYAGYREAVAAHDLATDADLTVSVDAFTAAEGARGVAQLLASGVTFDGVFCSNDSIAFGVISALQGAGLRVPEDVAVIGIDGVRATEFASPPLSTVAPDKDAIASAALDELDRQMRTPPGRDMPVQHVMVRASVIARASTGR